MSLQSSIQYPYDGLFSIILSFIIALIFFFSNEDIIVIVLLFVGDDMQYKPRFHSFIQQIVIEPFLPTRDYSRHLDYLNERTQTKIPVSMGGRET